MILEDLYPLAVKSGMKKNEFFHSTPRDIRLRIKSHIEKDDEEIKLIKFQSWLNGIYLLEAIVTSMDKKHEYPENPIVEDTKKQEIAKGNIKSEEQLNQEKLFLSLLVKEANARLGNQGK